MALSPGTKFGPFEIVAPLGAGGMGEVCRAHDTRLQRMVAIKILSAHLSANPEARERFHREVRTISSLNHPNICHLYDIHTDKLCSRLQAHFFCNSEAQFKTILTCVALVSASGSFMHTIFCPLLITP